MKYGRILLLAIGLAVALLLASPALPAAAAEGDGLIKAGDPTRDGSVGITIKCQRADKTVETIQVSVAILATDDAAGKATKIEDAIDALSPDCFTTGRATDEVTLDPNAGNTIILIRIDNDNTNETIGTKCSSSVAVVQGKTSFSGTTAGGTAKVIVGAVTA